jgi:hypothetical protein
MSAFLRRIRFLHPKIFQRTEGDEYADSTPAFRACVYPLGRPLHASLGVTPQCLPLTPQGAEIADAKSPLTELRQVVANYNAEDHDYLIRTIAFEAPDESDEGKAAVAHVILNRTTSGRWGGSIKDVVTHPWQLSHG